MPPTVQQFRAQLHRARLSSDDFAEAADYLAVISTAADDVHRRALLTAAVVAYARPFTNNSSGVEVNATPQLSVRLSKLFSQQEQQLHDELLALRNEVVAHTEYKRKPVKRIQGERYWV